MAISGDDVYRITSARQSRSVERDYRTKRYLVSMSIRTACFMAAIIVPGPMRWVLAAAAVVLPYISVVIANNASIEPPADIMPPLIIKDTSELPMTHPDRTTA